MENPISYIIGLLASSPIVALMARNDPLQAQYLLSSLFIFVVIFVLGFNAFVNKITKGRNFYKLGSLIAGLFLFASISAFYQIFFKGLADYALMTMAFSWLITSTYLLVVSRG